MFKPVLFRIELDRFWVTPGDKIFALYTFLSSGPSQKPLDVSVKLMPVGDGVEIDCSFSPCFPTTEWPERVYVREGYFPLYAPEDAVPGNYSVMVGLRDPESGEIAVGSYCKACEIEIAQPRFVTRREPITYDLQDYDIGEREKPSNLLVLKSDELEVVLDGDSGLPFRYRISSGCETPGAHRGASVTAAVHRVNPRASIARELKPVEASDDSKRAVFRFGVDFNGVPAAAFSLVYTLDGPTVSITIEDVKEADGYELIQVELPELASMPAAEQGAWLAYAEDGGQLCQLKDTLSGRLRATTEWRFSAPLAMIGKEGILAALEVPAYLDTTELTVDGEGDRKIAWLGTTKVIRTSGGSVTPNLPAGQNSLCKLHVLGDVDGNGKVDWLDAVHQIRPSMPKLPTNYYDNRNTYKIFIQCAGGGRLVTSFKQVEQIIRDFAALTDYQPQSVYLVGWQYTGHDSGYPAIDVVNQEAGGEEGLKQLMKAAAEVNCTISFHDNYDDAYKDSPDWQEEYIARYPDGDLMMGGYWAGGQTWITGMANYAEQRGWDRAVYTCRKYGIHGTYHIDVLSAEALRYDWNPSKPASAYFNLMGKYRIVDAFASCGADVTTEGVSWPFIGKVSWFFTLQQALFDRFGGESQIPMVQALFRHSTRWGGGTGSGTGALHSLCAGRSFGMELTSDPSTLTRAVDAFYIIQTPWFLLKDRPLTSWEKQEGIELLGYGPETYVKLDWNNEKYSIVIDGVEIARDHSTFCKLGEDKLVFYSIEPRRLSAPMPDGWSADGITARALYVGRNPEDVPVRCDGKTIEIDVPARRPVVCVSS